MRTAHKTPALVLTGRHPAEVDADLLIIPVFSDDTLADVTGLDQASGGDFSRARSRGEFSGKPYEVLVTSTAPSDWKTHLVMLVGAGPMADLTSNHLRRIAVVGGLAARQRRLSRVAVLFRSGSTVDPLLAAQAMAEGAVLANYDGAGWKTTGQPPSWVEGVEIVMASAPAGAQAGVDRGRILGESTNQAREMSNAPGNDLPPRVFAQRSVDLAASAGLAAEVLDEQQIEKLGMGLLLGVARGSQEPPRLVVLRYEPSGASSNVVLGLVGKGVTFDSGGISIKPADNMDKMKDDMSGGAAVICAMAAIARLALQVRCIGVVPMTENMPGGRAIKPGDVLTSAAGKTVEIINTDAEGRLVLGDAVWYARQLGATHLVDVATLTGACVVALGRTTSGLFGVPPRWVEQVRLASERAGERSWPMPVFDDYQDQLKSEIADITNSGGRAAGAITGALFVKEFAGDLPWVHMDIAGTAWAEEARPYQPKGATGVGVRTLVELASEAASWKNPQQLR